MKRNNLAWGLILILVGLGFLLFQVFPGIEAEFQWPWILIGVGTIFAVASVLTRTGGLMIPAFIIGGLGAIFLYQTNTDNWASWAYIWTIIPGFVGAGMLVGGLYDPDLRSARPASFILLAVSAVALVIFSGMLGFDNSLLQYWPVLLILAGAIVLIRSLLGSKGKSD